MRFPSGRARLLTSPLPYRVGNDHENNGDGCRELLGGTGGGKDGCHDHIDVSIEKLLRHRWKAFVFLVGVNVLEKDRPSVHVAEISEPLHQQIKVASLLLCVAGVPKHPHLRQLWGGSILPNYSLAKPER